ncbi:hypothetical protein GUJ93_ZPchr0005g15795 [Zizania palustris]|uniref:Uncharacterized protein n=1 Tax=Zizania palustris TaxID=103762 RepID=A0A8J5S2T7_ZIZPA|nr:hypothetical protein GUJ93_ZPchr0005g15795 [Zizania palustris]
MAHWLRPLKNETRLSQTSSVANRRTSGTHDASPGAKITGVPVTNLRGAGLHIAWLPLPVFLMVEGDAAAQVAAEHIEDEVAQTLCRSRWLQYN